MQLEAAIRDKSARVGVIGLGYVGLPLIRAFIAAGYRTLGFDVDQTKVDRLLKGQSDIAHLPGEWIAHCVAERQFEPSGDIRRLADAVVDRLTQALNDCGKPVKGSKICLLGVAYKKDVDDPRESPSFVLMELLMARGADLTYNDPHVPSLPKMRHHRLPAMKSVPLTSELLSGQDCVLIATNHSAYDYEFIVRHSPLVIDTRNATKGVSARAGQICKAWVPSPRPFKYRRANSPPAGDSSPARDKSRSNDASRLRIRGS